MNLLFEDLWNDYQYEKNSVMIEREKECINKEKELQERFCLTSEDKELFEIYFKLLADICTEREKKSFFEGLRFGVRFIIEALQ